MAGVKPEEVYISSRKGKANCFEIKTANRTFFLCAESEKERDDWIKVIRQNITGKANETNGVVRMMRAKPMQIQFFLFIDEKNWRSGF